MSYSPANYTGDGSTTNYSVPFPYLAATDVLVYVGGVTSAFTFLSSNLISITPAPGAGVSVQIARHTADTTKTIVYANGVSLTAQMLNASTDQLFYMDQEAVYVANAALHLNPSNVYDVGSVKLVNVATPTVAGDAVNLGYVTATFGANLATLAAGIATIGASATAAATSATGAATSKTAADADAAAAHTDRLAADADVVLTHADVVLTHADVSTTHADVTTANTAVTNATTQVGLAAAQVTLATAQTTAAAAQVALATTQAGNAATSATGAGTSKSAADADVVLTHADVVLTHADVLLTHADVTAANASAAAAAVSASTITAVEVQTKAAASLATPADTDIVPSVTPSATPVLHQSTWLQWKTALWTALGPAIAAFTAKATPVNADGYMITDSAASGASKFLSFTNHKAFMKTYWDTIYQPLVAVLTSLASLAIVSGDIVYGSAANTVARLAKGADGTVLTLASGLPSWAAIPAQTFLSLTGKPTTVSGYGITDAALSANVREKLTATRTYYVRTDGSDANTGLVDSAGGAFLTWQKAANIAYNSLDLNGFDVTIQKGSTNGTWTAGVNLTGAQVGLGIIHFAGDITTPANATLSITGGYGFNIQGAVAYIKGFKITTITSGNCLDASNNGTIVMEGKMEFGASPWNHIGCSAGGKVKNNGSMTAYTISGGAGFCHWAASQAGALILVQSCTITLTGTPAFGTAFAQSDTTGAMIVNANTYSGTATGKLYNATLNGVIQSGATLPGGTAGTTATGGQYL